MPPLTYRIRSGGTAAIQAGATAKRSFAANRRAQPGEIVQSFDNIDERFHAYLFSPLFQIEQKKFGVIALGL
jgi:hypothetical protein